jgi:hypothetical protein
LDIAVRTFVYWCAQRLTSSVRRYRPAFGHW